MISTVVRLADATERGIALFTGWLQDYMSILMFVALGLMFFIVGALLVWAALLRRAENAAVRAGGEKPSRRNASPGCLIVVGLPLALLGLIILGYLWYSFATVHVAPSGGMPV